MNRFIKVTLSCAVLSLTAACGFQPIYATKEGDAPVIRQVAVANIAAPESIEPVLRDALNARMAPGDGVAARYALYVEASERAERLAVQIDATVTRYNYRLQSRYTVIDNQTGERFRGIAQAMTSYNIVSSQYSTLFAERAAVEKATRQLAEKIERDILMRFAEPPEERNDLDEEEFNSQLDDSVILVEPRRGEIIGSSRSDR